MEPGETTKTRDRAPGLDGVRALAVLIVIGFHEGASGLSGGFLGVDLFFVLSGFLITTLLVEEYQRNLRALVAEIRHRGAVARDRRPAAPAGGTSGAGLRRRPTRAITVGAAALQVAHIVVFAAIIVGLSSDPGDGGAPRGRRARSSIAGRTSSERSVRTRPSSVSSAPCGGS